MSGPMPFAEVILLGKKFISLVHQAMEEGDEDALDMEGPVQELHVYLHEANNMLESQQRQIESLANLLNEECKRNVILENKLRIR